MSHVPQSFLSRCVTWRFVLLSRVFPVWLCPSAVSCESLCSLSRMSQSFSSHRVTWRFFLLSHVFPSGRVPVFLVSCVSVLSHVFLQSSLCSLDDVPQSSLSSVFQCSLSDVS